MQPVGVSCGASLRANRPRATRASARRRVRCLSAYAHMPQHPPQASYHAPTFCTGLGYVISSGSVLESFHDGQSSAPFDVLCRKQCEAKEDCAYAHVFAETFAHLNLLHAVPPPPSPPAPPHPPPPQLPPLNPFPPGACTSTLERSNSHTYAHVTSGPSILSRC
jgi:hypothetical protein